MGKIRFRLKHRVATIFRYVFRRHRSPARYIRLRSTTNRPMYMRRFFNWTNSLKNKAKGIICSKRFGSGYVPDHGYMHMGQESPAPVPKGYVTVYVGQKDGDFERVFVPVFYFKQPLFCELLKEAEEEYGYDHPGGITLPCPISEFENVQTRIKRNRVTRNMFVRKLL
ncbi:hypothetical protein LIER_04468 [Lithospermum erythrorhizon]|uniref:Uncharacterized protein n=1 Tax=Lithospermum erythrorhizon TaxID=34254 RepID=A0AAV3NWT2_LITER